MFRSQEITFEAALRDLSDPSYKVRTFAAAALGTCDEADRDEAAAALRRALSDPRAEVRYAAAISLAALRDVQAVAPLCGLLADSDVEVREAAALALGRTGDVEGAWGALAEALSAGVPAVRFQAAASLAELDPVRAAPLLRAALTDEDPEVRASAAAGLAEVPPDPETRAALLPLLADLFAAPRFEGALALARLRDPRAAPVLIEFLGDRLRALDAAQALALLQDERSRAPLLRILRRFFAPRPLKVRAAYALMRLGDPAGRAYLEKAARARNEMVRGLAEEMLSGSE
jgi:HEAT repeat protein